MECMSNILYPIHVRFNMIQRINRPKSNSFPCPFHAKWWFRRCVVCPTVIIQNLEMIYPTDPFGFWVEATKGRSVWTPRSGRRHRSVPQPRGLLHAELRVPLPPKRLPLRGRSTVAGVWGQEYGFGMCWFGLLFFVWLCLSLCHSIYVFV